MASSEWEPTWMLTARVRMVPGTEWKLAHNQRVHVHHGTAEILARCALLEDEELAAGADRAGFSFVSRSRWRRGPAIASSSGPTLR